jgi:hypothetical protein
MFLCTGPLQPLASTLQVGVGGRGGSGVGGHSMYMHAHIC